MIIKKIFDFLNSYAPFAFQESWDNSGLQIGDLNKKVSRALLSLDVTLDTVLEAKELGAQLIISHHPLFFKPLKCVDCSNNIVKTLLDFNISVISNHTPLDLVPKGVSFSLGMKLNLKNMRVLSPSEEKFFYKLFFNVPTGMERTILSKIFSEGVGEYLYYKNCAFETFGEGRFSVKDDENRVPYLKASNPYKEGKIEVLVRKDRINWVIDKIRSIHPYDELAFDVFEESVNPLNIGYGAIGELSTPKKLSSVIDLVKESLGISKVRYTGDLNRKVKKVAVLGGSGSSFIKDAIRASAEVFISGDIKYHDALDYGDKISILDVGHRASEEPVLFYLKEQISKEFKEVEFFISKSFGDFYKYI
ncbi:MAG: Nif3-like dinuclear metal center hexameric protein [Proteobacteria bacterium]|nr:Nif3-like dinuclear metal center hexameric protein [Pseudomonadota bacterium]